MNLLFSLLALSFVVFFHELGHFLFAKIFGVRVEVFSIGFGPKLFAYRHRETQYCLSFIPLGGYVKLQGEVVSTNAGNMQDNQIACKQDSYSLFAKHPFQRVLILFAGPLFNVLLAFLLYVYIFLQGVPSYSKEPIVGKIDSHFPASKMLQTNDKILSINGQTIHSFEEISKSLNPTESPALLDTQKDSVLSNTTVNATALVVVSRQGASQDKESAILELEVPLRHSSDNRLILGVSPLQEMQPVSLQDSLVHSAKQTLDTALVLYRGLKDLFIGAIGLNAVSSVIGITEVSLKALNADFLVFLWVIAFISINLGIINLLPLPLLDGGQIVYVCCEWLTGRQVNPEVAKVLVVIGIALIITIMGIGIYNDIERLFSHSL
ncbi:RIP metalloprotease RseP [Helicobacter aurati]|uniref:Zinc metalloprotease n=1 Tax=Helicobacter aurati TaxID=137778 RepID=A0A3D8J7K7_9HELI|nr:RIP metalloprotease RseP [Helicobacter aurati]RDU73175.1 RIP metalloprotease RseP [Helicobacter aurati]